MGQHGHALNSRVNMPVWAGLVGILVFYLATRVVFSSRYPLFNDEAIYLRYGAIMTETPLRFYSLAAIGKQPLLYWAYGLSSRVIPDPRWAGRSISIALGLGTTVTIFFLGRGLAGGSAGLMSAFLYAVSPVALLFDGLAVADSALTLLFALMCSILIRPGERLTTRVFIVLGILTGVGFWVKTTALLFALVVLPITSYRLWRVQRSVSKLLVGLLLFLASVYLVTLPLLVRPEMRTFFRFQNEYALTIAELLTFPFRHWLDNLISAGLVFVGYVSPLVVLAAIMAVYKTWSQSRWRTMSIAWIASLVVLVLTGRTIHSRYVVFSIVPMLLLASALVTRIVLLVWVVGISMTSLSVLLSMYPAQFFHAFPAYRIFASESWQYIDGWPSGYGVMEAIRFVDRDRGGKRAFVGVRWDSGNPEDTVLLYAQKYDGIESTFFDPKLETFSSLVDTYQNVPIYLITRNDQRMDLDANLTLLARFPKPFGRESVEVYRYRL